MSHTIRRKKEKAKRNKKYSKFKEKTYEKGVSDFILEQLTKPEREAEEAREKLRKEFETSEEEEKEPMPCIGEEEEEEGWSDEENIKETKGFSGEELEKRLKEEIEKSQVERGVEPGSLWNELGFREDERGGKRKKKKRLRKKDKKRLRKLEEQRQKEIEEKMKRENEEKTENQEIEKRKFLEVSDDEIADTKEEFALKNKTNHVSKIGNTEISSKKNKMKKLRGDTSESKII